METPVLVSLLLAAALVAGALVVFVSERDSGRTDRTNPPAPRPPAP